MTQETIRLIAPSLALEAAYQECAGEYSAHGEDFLGPAAADWPAYVRQCDEEAHGIVRLPARVAQTVLLLARETPAEPLLLGVAKLRHTLNPTLEDMGGHIGYSIRPSERGKGYGALILANTLEHARALGLSRVLLTCDPDNIPSVRVILRNGGVLTSEGFSPTYGRRISRYWIAL